ncbi:MAG: YajQ family cyclic di-GMP-binding protein [Gammaproteobacteria bacterium]|nr:YajQ family cyclic di-GMP-binding protein [Gammaproteobacteria bacterium]
MPTFDVVSEVDLHEVSNAVDQTRREVESRFDFRGIDARVALNDDEVKLTAQSDFQVDQLLDILRTKLAKRGVDIGILEVGEAEPSGKTVSRTVKIRQGIDSLLAKKIVKMIKDEKLKVQAAIQGEKIRVSGKKRDDLQAAIAFLKDSDIDMPLQFNNFRD